MVGPAVIWDVVPNSAAGSVGDELDAVGARSRW